MANMSHYDTEGLRKKSFELNGKQNAFIKKFGKATYRSDSDVIRFALNKLEKWYISNLPEDDSK